MLVSYQINMVNPYVLDSHILRVLIDRGRIAVAVDITRTTGDFTTLRGRMRIRQPHHIAKQQRKHRGL